MLYEINEVKLDIDELISQIKLLQIAVQSNSNDLSKQDIDNILELVLNKLNLIRRNVNYI